MNYSNSPISMIDLASKISTDVATQAHILRSISRAINNAAEALRSAKSTPMDHDVMDLLGEIADRAYFASREVEVGKHL